MLPGLELRLKEAGNGFSVFISATEVEKDCRYCEEAELPGTAPIEVVTFNDDWASFVR